MKGSPVASLIYKELGPEVESLKGRGIAVGLAMVIVGDRASSRQYLENTRNLCRRLGILDYPYRLPEGASLNELLHLIKKLNEDMTVSGILALLPLPAHIDPRVVLNAITPEKDVDGLGAISIGRLAAEESTYQLGATRPCDIGARPPAISGTWPVSATFLPCTPYGVIMLLEHYGVGLKGKDVVVVGKSLTVGKSLALMALAKEATVTVCHRETKNLGEKTLQADILCVAAGRPGLITADMVKEGAVVVDIGITELPDGRFLGDVDFKGSATPGILPVSEKASYITPVPGGVGPVTIAILLKNTVSSTKRMFGIP